MPYTDPFSDPIAPRITVSQPVHDMPQYVNFGTSLHHYIHIHLLIVLLIDRNLLTIVNKNPLRHIIMVRLLCLYRQV